MLVRRFTTNDVAMNLILVSGYLTSRTAPLDSSGDGPEAFLHVG